MSLQKLASLPFGDENLSSAVRLGDRILAFTDKYEDQPEYNCGRRSLLSGGNFAFFDVSTEKWSETAAFPMLIADNAERQRLNDLLFVVGDSAFLLVYDRFFGLKIHSLWRFGSDGFEKISQFDAVIHEPEGDDHTFGSNVVAVQSVADNPDEIFFVAKIFGLNGFGFGVFSIRLGASVELTVELPWLEMTEVTSALDALPIAAVRLDDQIFISVAERGCGYRWRTDDLVLYKISTKKFSILEIPSGKYRLVPMPSNSVFDSKSNKWIFFGSPSAIGGSHLGVRNSESKLLAIESLLSAQPFWSQSLQAVNDSQHDDIYIPFGDQIFVASTSKGICRLTVGDFYPLPQTENL